MHRARLCIFLCLVVSAVVIPLSRADYAENRENSQQPEGLMVELAALPELTAITDPRPEFGWVVPTTCRGDAQTAYQIMVATDPDLLMSGSPDRWDSGRVDSGKSVAVEYQGRALESHHKYFWKVRTWNRSREKSQWSEPQEFNTGDLETKGHDRHTAVRYPPIETEVSPLRIERTPNGRYFIDFGRAAFGTVVFTCQSPVAQKLIVRLGEKRGQGKRVDPFPGATIRTRTMAVDLAAGRHDYRVSIRSDKRNTGPATIRMPENVGEVMPFRYAEVMGTMAPLRIEDIKQVRVHYPFDLSASYFKSSDPVLNDVWDLCRYSIYATSFAGVYVDGDRERIPYEADAYINQLGHYAADREYTLARYSHEYLIMNPTWPTEWAMHSVFMAWADYMYTGDRESLQEFYPDLKAKTLFEQARDDGLISVDQTDVPEDLYDRLHMNDSRFFKGGQGRLKDVVDWPPGERDGFEMKPVNTVVNSFHYRALGIMARIAGELGEEGDRKFFSERAEAVKTAINEKLFDPDSGLYVDGEGSLHSSLHANMFPLAFGVVPESRKPRVTSLIKQKGMACSVYAAQYLLEAMYEAGEEEYALKLMTDTGTDRSWPHMIYDVGTTITLEAWAMKYKPNLDWNHAWGAAPANIIPRKLMGVEPIEPGFEVVRIRPRLGSIESARLVCPTIRGPIKMEYLKRDDGSREYKLVIPANVRARVHLPVLSPDLVMESGVPARKAKGVRYLGREGEDEVFEVGAGDYCFVAK